MLEDVYKKLSERKEKCFIEEISRSSIVGLCFEIGEVFRSVSIFARRESEVVFDIVIFIFIILYRRQEEN